MKADDQLYCWIMEWRDVMRARHGVAVSYTDDERGPDRQTIYGQFADEAERVLAACDKAQPLTPDPPATP